MVKHLHKIISKKCGCQTHPHKSGPGTGDEIHVEPLCRGREVGASNAPSSFSLSMLPRRSAPVNRIFSIFQDKHCRCIRVSHCEFSHICCQCRFFDIFNGLIVLKVLHGFNYRDRILRQSNSAVCHANIMDMLFLF